ncbi:carboxypeptidase-like regulatory domain-containing protein [Pedobacter frigoris]|uniref:Carboxypeptidase regulatory-like domain-containing protein n=1 Tax=Pedobacter frigoris TaxID=2571272 RepID=A0A4U1CF53_9SPHI|nr:carboxypeptidase-like regulatory domain-containing protein [Pedobacter frigoris]TKC05083.1 carboxypeptidase regulatory-like domain-containing protein [Pedobacter frigoris]
MVPVFNGISYGSLVLNEDLPRGNYTLRGYTSWMLNFGENYQFEKELYVSNGPDTEWLIGYHAKVKQESGKDNVRLNLRINEFDKAPVGLREMQVSITNGKKTWFKSKTETSLEGNLELSFDIPDKIPPKELALTIQDLRKSQGLRSVKVPLTLNRPQYIDLQFMPEGGVLVANRSSKIAFKALNEDGYGVNVRGKIYNSKQEEVGVFASSHKGMGAFNLNPKAGETYSAKLEFADGSYKTYPFPMVMPSGIALSVDNLFDRDSCELTLSPSEDLKVGGKEYYIMGLSGSMVCWAATINFKKGQIKTRLNKAIFPDGIVRFVLADQNIKPLAERMVYNHVNGNLNIDVQADKSAYVQRDSISLKIKATDKNGNPASGSFSIAITDDAQVKKDSIADDNILSRMFLSSVLKGHVEDPGYYYNGAINEEKWRNMEYLLLTQGWVGYDWQETLKPIKPMIYASEQEFLVKGKVTNAFNKPVAKSGITLLSKKPLLIMDTLTNDKGDFEFKGLFPVDTAAFFISARNKNGKKFNVGIDMYEFKPPAFPSVASRTKPWFVNIDTLSYAALNQQLSLQKTYRTVTGKNMLKEVKIIAKKLVKGSKNLNGPGGADLIIDEADILKAGKVTLGDLLTKRVKGFHQTISRFGQPVYKVNGEAVYLIMDGMDTKFFLTEGTAYGEYLKQLFEYYDADEIKGIEVMIKGKNIMSYGSRFLNPMAEKPWDFVFIEVTTRAGNGPLLKKAIGNYVYKPIPFTIPRKFYAPRYLPETIADMSDIRATVHWEPDVVTDKDGNATVKFFAADNPGNYTFVIEGADLQGSLGSKTNKIVIKKR